MNWVRRALTVTTILADVLPFENGVARTETPCHYLAKLGGCEHDTGECDRGRNPGRGRRRGNPFLYAAGLMNPSTLMSDFRTQSAGRILSPTRYN